MSITCVTVMALVVRIILWAEEEPSSTAMQLWGQAYCADSNFSEERAVGLFLDAIELSNCSGDILIALDESRYGPGAAEWNPLFARWRNLRKRCNDESIASGLPPLPIPRSEWPVDDEAALISIQRFPGFLRGWRQLATSHDERIRRWAVEQLKKADSQNGFTKVLELYDVGERLSANDFIAACESAVKCKMYRGVDVSPPINNPDFLLGYEFESIRLVGCGKKVEPITEILKREWGMGSSGVQANVEERVQSKLLGLSRQPEHRLRAIRCLVQFAKLKSRDDETIDGIGWCSWYITLNRACQLSRRENALPQNEAEYLDQVERGLSGGAERIRDFFTRLDNVETSKGEKQAINLFLEECAYFKRVFEGLPE